MSSHDFLVEYTIQFTECNLAPKEVERYPVLRLYLDRNFDRTNTNGGINAIRLDEDDLSRTYDGTLRGNVLSRVLPASACIGFAARAMVRTDAGTPCYASIGTNHITIDEIRAALLTAKAGRVSFDIPIAMNTTKLFMDAPIQKGTLRFTVRRMEISPRVAWKEMSTCIMQSRLQSEHEKAVTDFIKARFDFETSIPDNDPDISNIRAFMSISNSGIELTGTYFVPIEQFAMAEDTPLNVDYLQNALERQMSRQNLTIREFRLLDASRKAELMVEVCAYAAQEFPYLSDSVNVGTRNDARQKLGVRFRKQMIELFGNSGTFAAGDCEDGGLFIYLTFRAFRNHPIVQHANPELAELQKLAQAYLPYLTLSTVRNGGAKVADGEGHGVPSRRKPGAHLYAIFIPKTYARECLSRTPAGKRFAETKFPDPSRVWVGNAAGASSGESLALPTLVGEGTGRIRPLGPGPLTVTPKHHVRSSFLRADHPIACDPLIKERMFVGESMSIRGIPKQEISHTAGMPSSFYLQNLLGITSDFIDTGVNVGVFVFATKDPATGAISRGVDFVDLINQRSNVTLVPYPEVPPPIMDIMTESAKLEEPSISYELDPRVPMPATSEEERHLLDKMQQTVADFKRTGKSPYGTVDLFFLSYQVTAPLVGAMISDFQRMRPVYKVGYEIERITTAMYGYRVMLHVDRTPFE